MKEIVGIAPVEHPEDRHVVVSEEGIRQARQAEYEYRHKPFEERLAAMILATFYNEVPKSIVFTYDDVYEDEELS